LNSISIHPLTGNGCFSRSSKAEEALIIREQIEDPNAAKVRAQLAAWREQTNT
jgi:hypothetical protein